MEQQQQQQQQQQQDRPPPPPRNEINHIRHRNFFVEVEEEDELISTTTKKKNKKNNQQQGDKSFFESVFSSIFGSEDIDEEGDDEEDNKQQQQQQERRTRQRRREEDESTNTPPKYQEEKQQQREEDANRNDEEDDEDTESKFSERLRNASGSTKFELERKAREEIRSMKGVKAKAKLIDSNEAFRAQALLRLKAKIDKHIYDERGDYVTEVPVNPTRAMDETLNAPKNNVPMDIDAKTAEDKLTPHQRKQRKEELRRIRERDDYRVQESVTSESRYAFNGSWNYDRDEFLREGDKYENQYHVEERKHKLLRGVLSAAEMNLPEHEQPLRMAESIVDTIVECALENNGKYEWKLDEEEVRKREKKFEERRKEEMRTMKKMLNADEISDDDDNADADDDEDDDYFEEEMRIHRRENKLLTEKLVKSIPDSLELIERMNSRKEQIKAQKDKLKLKKTKQKYIDKIERQEKESKRPSRARKSSKRKWKSKGWRKNARWRLSKKSV